MAVPIVQSSSPTTANPTPEGRFGAGLNEAEVRRFQALLREQCGTELPLSETWSRAIEMIALVESLLCTGDAATDLSTGFALSRS